MPPKDPKFPLGMMITGSHPQSLSSTEGTVLIKQSVYSDTPAFSGDRAAASAVEQMIMHVLPKEQYKDEESRYWERKNWIPTLISPIRTTGFGEYEALYSVRKTD